MSKSVTINMKADLQVRNLIDHAVKISHQNRTDFILSAAIQRAEELILDQQFIAVDAERFEHFTEALDAPPAKNVRLEKTMERKSPWD